MKLDGAYTFNAGREKVWNTLLSPEALSGCIPGCQSFTPTSDDSYDVALKVGVGAITGSYKAVVRLTERDEPSSYRMAVEGKGSGTTLRGTGVIRLTEKDGATTVEFEGDAQVTGIIARVGQRLMGTAAKGMINQFFACMKEKAEA